ncbi:MAG: sialate O-acetylesterase [Planctomycetota bacterium]
MKWGVYVVARRVGWALDHRTIFVEAPTDWRWMMMSRMLGIVASVCLCLSCSTTKTADRSARHSSHDEECSESHGKEHDETAAAAPVEKKPAAPAAAPVGKRPPTPAPEPAPAGPAKVKVFILSGQSNMEGKAKVSLLEHQVKDPKTRDFFKHLQKDGKWVERDDVRINYLDRRGKLTVGYGSPGRFGVELEFGNTVGDHFKEPVLLVKTAWGGKSIGKDFRPPSSGLPPEEKLQQELEKTNANNRKKKRPEVTIDEVKARYGHYYREMMKEISTCLAEIGTRFPDYDGRGYEIVGFVWFQGWNDMCNRELAPQYAEHMENFIRDVRKDLKAPKLPIVIGQMGQNMSKPATGGMLLVKDAQAAMEEVPEFRGNVKCVKTDVLVDKAAEELYPHWRKRFKEWEQTGSDRGYHYLGSAIWFSRMGTAFGEAMLDLMGEK